MTPEVREIALSYMEGLDCARSLTVAIMLRYGEWDQIFGMKTDPNHYPTPELYRAAICSSDFLRKLDEPELSDSNKLESDAITKWLWAEAECFRANRRINEIIDFGTLNGVPADNGLLEFFSRLRKNLLYLLGSGPDNWEVDGRFGPGATVSDRSKRTTVLDKLSSVPTITSSALFYLVPWIGTAWGRASACRGDDVKFVKGNIFFTVPKTATSRRSCAKEPSLNGFYQLSLGRALRRRLKAHGIDLENGQSIHRRVACDASKDGRLCTIDLSSASDTLCTSLVRCALPSGWYNHLNDLRSAFTRVRGRWHKLEKFSSMGNGYTFELETAIFLAICMSADPSLVPGVDLLVYGDDIIVPTDSSRVVLAALRFCGFTPNLEKTFVSGEFRESCGGDYFRGEPVRAHYLRKFPREPQDYISLANGIRRVLRSFDLDSHRRRRLLRAWHRSQDYLPRAVKLCRGPEELGDIVIHDCEERWSIRWRNSIRWLRCYRVARTKRARMSRYHCDVQMAAVLYGVAFAPMNPRTDLDHATRGLPVRDGVLGYKIGRVPYS